VQHANPGPALSRGVPTETQPIPTATSGRHYSSLADQSPPHRTASPLSTPPLRPRPARLHDESNPTMLS
jgi:hypothetical protein